MLLPAVEDGTVTLIGATTENPYFSLNTPLLSRCLLLRLEPLTADDIRALLARALADAERGLGDLELELADDALEHLVTIAGGDARMALMGSRPPPRRPTRRASERSRSSSSPTPCSARPSSTTDRATRTTTS